jgi:thymidylate synthase
MVQSLQQAAHNLINSQECFSLQKNLHMGISRRKGTEPEHYSVRVAAGLRKKTANHNSRILNVTANEWRSKCMAILHTIRGEKKKDYWKIKCISYWTNEGKVILNLVVCILLRVLDQVQGCVRRKP